MVELIKDLPASVVIAMLCGVLMLLLAIAKAGWWGFTQWWSDRKERDQGLINALQANTLAIQRLEIQVDHLNQFLHVVPKLQADVNLAHQRLRDISKKPVTYDLP